MTESVSDKRIVRVDLADRSYDILIGPDLLTSAGGETLARLNCRKVAIVSDVNVAPLYLDTLVESLQTDGIETFALTLAAGEKTKSFDNLTAVVDFILDARIERADAVIAGCGVKGYALAMRRMASLLAD